MKFNRIRVFENIIDRDGTVRFTAGCVYSVVNVGRWSVQLHDNLGELTALLNNEFEVTV